MTMNIIKTIIFIILIIILSREAKSESVIDLIDAAAVKGGGIVTLPTGIIHLSQQLIIKPHVHIVCDDNGYDYGSNQLTQGKGTLFSIEWGNYQGASNDSTAAAILLQTNSSIENCGFFYPYQDSTSTIPTEYGATILGAASGASARYNFCSNCYSFLDFRGSVSNTDLANIDIRNNWGSPIAYGLRINRVSDWSRYDHNTFHAGYFDFDDWQHLPGWSAKYGIAFEVGPADWVGLESEVEVGYAIGVEILESSNNYGNKGPISINDSSFDACGFACVAILNGGPLINLRIVNSTFTAYDIINKTQSQMGMVVFGDSLSSIWQMQFIGNYVFGPTNTIFYLLNIGDLIATNNTVNINSTIGWPAFMFTNANKVRIRNNTLRGFSSIYSGQAIDLIVDGN